MKAVIDTNVLRIAAKQHKNVSDDCIANCIKMLLVIQENGIVVIDNDYHILGEYLKKPSMYSNEVGGKFLKWLLQNQHNALRVEQVKITEVTEDNFVEFPDLQLETDFDFSDRKFVAVANAHPEKPPILQAADSKWLGWWQCLHKHGIPVQFLCPEDACRFYNHKFPSNPMPALPQPKL